LPKTGDAVAIQSIFAASLYFSQDLLEVEKNFKRKGR
jgi:hypothetical protein